MDRSCLLGMQVSQLLNRNVWSDEAVSCWKICEQPQVSLLNMRESLEPLLNRCKNCPTITVWGSKKSNHIVTSFLIWDTMDAHLYITMSSLLWPIATTILSSCNARWYSFSLCTQCPWVAQHPITRMLTGSLWSTWMSRKEAWLHNTWLYLAKEVYQLNHKLWITWRIRFGMFWPKYLQGFCWSESRLFPDDYRTSCTKLFFTFNTAENAYHTIIYSKTLASTDN